MNIGLIGRNELCMYSTLAIETVEDLFSPKLGKTTTRVCTTCYSSHCVGHCSHIDLPFLIPHPIYHGMIPMLLSSFCDKCNVVLRVDDNIHLFKEYYKIITSSQYKVKQNVCNCITPTVKIYKYGWRYLSTSNTYDHNNPSSYIHVLPSGKTIESCIYLDKVRDKLSSITIDDMKAMKLNTSWKPVDLLIDYVMVMPPLLRPSANSRHACDIATDIYKRILSLIRNGNDASSQLRVFNYYNQLLGRRNDDKQKLFKNFISGKTGLIRGSMLSVRNNRAARTVITTNSYIPVSHVGMPRIFKRSLTVFEYLNVRTVNKIAILMSNDMIVSPGNMDIKKVLGVGSVQSLSKVSMKDLITKLLNACSNKLLYVERELMDNDWVYINRQPTLQHTSIIAFKAKLVDVPTMELNLAATKTFNADFDGDAMSIYVASDIESRAECTMMLSSEVNIYSISDGKLLIQPVQDCISALYTMTRFDKDCSMATLLRVVDVCLMGEYKYGRWSTREFLLRHNHVRGSSNITATTLIGMILPKDLNTSISTIARIVDGIFLPMGAMKGFHIHILIKILHDKYGASYTIWFISMIQLVADIWLKEYPLSIGYSDCCVLPEEVLDKVTSYYYSSFDKIANYEHRKMLYPDLSQYFEMQILTVIRGQVGDPTRKAVSEYLTKYCPSNPFSIMADSTARGNFTAISNIMAYLGQQEVNGRQLPLYDVNEDGLTHPINRGFVLEAYNLGLSMRGAYYQAASGRQGIVNTGSGISDPGVMYRLLWSFLADVKVDYEGRITDYTGTVLETS